MQWFPVDKHVRNDWRTKAVRREFGIAGLGHLMTLWSFVATEGSQTDEGRGVQRDGTPLDLRGMAEECAFADVDALRTFLDLLAGIGHIDPTEWHEHGIVFLPAMNRRLAAYRTAKGRGQVADQVRRGPGRPRKTPGNSGELREIPGNSGKFRGTPGNSGIIPPELSRSHPKSEPNPGPNNTPSNAETDENRPEIVGSDNSGESREMSGNSGQVPNVLLGSSDPDHLEDHTQGNTGTRPTPAALVELWNRVRDPGPKILELTPQRQQRYRAALKAKPDLTDWEHGIRYLNGATWANACGEGTHANFRADLDYLAKPGNLTKALERLAAMALPGVRTGAAAGRVAPTAGKFATALKTRDGEN